MTKGANPATSDIGPGPNAKLSGLIMHRNQTKIPSPALAIQSLGIGLGPTFTPKIFPDCCGRQDRLPSAARPTIVLVFLDDEPLERSSPAPRGALGA